MQRPAPRALPLVALALCAVLQRSGDANLQGPQASPNRSPAATAQGILARSSPRRGLCALLGVERGLALELARGSELKIYAQLARDEDVALLRRSASAAGLYGTRIWAERGNPRRIHLADEIADLVIAAGDYATAGEKEVLRVLRPGGNALLGGRELTKPVPRDIDAWSHPYHGPDNNPLSHDRRARAPYLTRFLADPRYAPLPQTAVAAGGRVFKAFGHVAFKEREEPWLNTLAAFNGYNGALLWRRALVPGIMVHRNTLIATAELLLLGDDRSCKLIDAATGRVRDEIAPPAEIAGGTFWKWMALEDGVLYALIGEQEERDPVERHHRENHGWPWDKISAGFNMKENPWGFGRNLLAIEVATKKVLWHHHEEQPIDSRALCMNGTSLFGFRHGAYLFCLDRKSGAVRWRRSAGNPRDAELFAALGPYLGRQGWSTNWRTAAYLKCSEQALYFAGPPIGKLLAVSASDGRVLWENPYDNFQLVLRDEGLVAISGPFNVKQSRIFDPLSGKVLAEMAIGRRACSRPTGSIDAVFFRARGGSVRLDMASRKPQWISPMRAQCHDGVTIANGLLYWWPSVCDCNLSIYGITALGPAGGHRFGRPAAERERLERGAGDPARVAALPVSPADWPTFRANNTRTATSGASIPAAVRRRWIHTPAHAATPTAPVAAGGLVFLGDSRGAVVALDGASGEPRWRFLTGGAIRIPPTIWQGRALVGSGDGWIYCLEAASGRLLWRFRAAPLPRKIPVYGRLLSTWPVASGVLVSDGVAYAAAGILNYDGTEVFALDASTGRIVWQNNRSGHLLPEARTGVSVQGHLLLDDKRLYLAGGTSVSPAVYTTAEGRCLNDPAQLAECEARGSRGWELYKVGSRVVACGRPYYAHPEYEVYDGDVHRKLYVAPGAKRDIVLVDQRELLCYPHIPSKTLDACVANRGEQSWFSYEWGKFELKGVQPLWRQSCRGTVAVATAANAVTLAGKNVVLAIDRRDGSLLWQHPLPATAVPWGLAVSGDGSVIASLKGGTICCLEGR